ncbi:MAG TPA: hypothetical protein VK133_02985, partial [Amoebophilaceae bacterium]|nr:hypothetical protein [Amoebophilaceae bacterium]
YRYLSSYQTNRYIDRFQELMDTYNSTDHRTIGMAPKEVNESTLSTVLNKLYAGHLWSSDTDQTHPKFAIGAKVRISLSTKFFSKGYKGFWTAETFIINTVKRYPSGKGLVAGRCLFGVFVTVC